MVSTPPSASLDRFTSGGESSRSGLGLEGENGEYVSGVSLCLGGWNSTSTSSIGGGKEGWEELIREKLGCDPPNSLGGAGPRRERGDLPKTPLPGAKEGMKGLDSF